MRAKFPLFNTPIDLAHQFWARILRQNDLVIDATCGNGKDSLVLAKLLTPLHGLLVCIDLQQEAIKAARMLLEQEIPDFLPSVQFYQQSHEKLPPLPLSACLRLIVFNLGYLPGGDKSVTTQVGSTLQSISQALSLLAPGGMVSITCYPGHEEGKKEEETLRQTFSSLDPALWSFSTFFWTNRHASPSLFLIQKKSSI